MSNVKIFEVFIPVFSPERMCFVQNMGHMKFAWWGVETVPLIWIVFSW